MYKEKLETRDLILKKAAMEDAYDMYRNIWSEEESTRYMLWTPIKSMDEAVDRMSKTIEFQKDRIAYCVYEKQSGQAIGFAGMKEIDDGVYEESGIGFEYSHSHAMIDKRNDLTTRLTFMNLQGSQDNILVP